MAELVGGAALGAIFGELLKAVLEMKDKATTFQPILSSLQITLGAIAPVIKEIEQHNNDLGRRKEELEGLIRQMEDGMKLVSKCSRIHRLNYLARIRNQEQLLELLIYFKFIEMQTQTARDLKEVLLIVRSLHSKDNKLTYGSSEDTRRSDSDLDVSDSESFYSAVTQLSENAPGFCRTNSTEQFLEDITSLTQEGSQQIMAASVVGGAAVGAVFGELLKAVLEMTDKAIMFKQTLASLRSTLVALAPVIKEIEQHNDDLGRPKEELESLIRGMEEGTKLVSKCSKIHRLNYIKRVRYQKQLVALVDSIVRFFTIDMQVQTARDQKETLLEVRRILSDVNKLPSVSTEATIGSSSDFGPVPVDVSESDIHDSMEMQTAESVAGTNSADQVRENVTQQVGQQIMAASLVGGAVVEAVFGKLLKAVLEMTNKANMFKQTLAYLRSTLVAIAPVIKEIEQHNNDLGRPKEELESLIRGMEEGTKLVSKCSKIHSLNYPSRVRYQEQLVALVNSLERFFMIDMQAQTARDQKETLLEVTRMLSEVNKLPSVSTEDTTGSSSDFGSMPVDVSESEIHDSTEMQTVESVAGTNSADQVRENVTQQVGQV